MADWECSRYITSDLVVEKDNLGLYSIPAMNGLSFNLHAVSHLCLVGETKPCL